MTVVAPASRNAPCPCGSGRRYKECHGALASVAPDADAADAEASPRMAMLQEALAHQQAGDLAAAMRAYERVLAAAPDDFDALHMLGVVHYQRHAFDRAEALLRTAIAQRPDVVAAHQNLALLLEARRLEDAEDALCRAVLPRLAQLCAPPRAFESIVAARRPIDLLDGAMGSEDRRFAELAGGLLGAATVHTPVAEPLVDRIVALPRGMLDAPVTILFGLAAPLAAFPPAPRATERVLVVDRDAPSALHDRLREMSDEGNRPVHVRYTTSALRDLVRLPGGMLPATRSNAS
jgi:tetratricopeptide (TPR) repeat protein